MMDFLAKKKGNFKFYDKNGNDTIYSIAIKSYIISLIDNGFNIGYSDDLKEKGILCIDFKCYNKNQTSQSYFEKYTLYRLELIIPEKKNSIMIRASSVKQRNEKKLFKECEIDNRKRLKTINEINKIYNKNICYSFDNHLQIIIFIQHMILNELNEMRINFGIENTKIEYWFNHMGRDWKVYHSVTNEKKIIKIS